MRSNAKVSLSFLLISIFTFSQACGQFPEPASDENAGFEQIITEKSFDDWHGRLEFWRFEEGVLIGEVPEDGLLDENTFLVWDEEVDDFELKVEYRISAEGNSGIQYRSQIVDGQEDVLKGYQADSDGPNEWSGQLYEEKGRGFLALRGQITYIGTDNEPAQIGSLGGKEELSEVYKPGQWNKYHLIVQGNTMIHMLNGRVMSVAIDDGSKAKSEGLLGFQLHQGPAMKVEYRNLLFKEL